MCGNIAYLFAGGQESVQSESRPDCNVIPLDIVAEVGPCQRDAN
jgi:hypothetical protein